MKLRKVLVPVDFSRGSRFSLDYALGFAEIFGGSVEILHIVPPPFDVFEVPENDRDYREELRALSQEHFDVLLGERRGAPDMPVTTRIDWGDPARCIVGTARNDAHDLVVLGVRPHGGGAGRIGESVVEAVVRSGVCPVLAVKALDEGTPAESKRFELGSDLDLRANVGEILFPTDLSQRSLSRLSSAADLAEKCQASLRVLHVLHDPKDYPLADLPSLVGGDYEEFLQNMEERARDRLRSCLQEKLSGVNWVNFEIERGNPARAILRSAESSDCDLIVIPSGGVRGVLRLILGNAVERVLRQARCPVLVLPDG